MRDDHMFDIDSESEDEFGFSGEEQDDNVDSDDNGSVASGYDVENDMQVQATAANNTSKLPVLCFLYTSTMRGMFQRSMLA
jgi:hypothetical protein